MSLLSWYFWTQPLSDLCAFFLDNSLKPRILVRNVLCVISEPYHISWSLAPENERQCIMIDYEISKFDVISSWVISKIGTWMKHGATTNEINKECMLEGSFMVGWTYEAPSSKWRRHMLMHGQSSEHQDHWIIYTLYHLEVKLWYNMSTLITQQHNIMTRATQPTCAYQQCHVKFCHESPLPHHYIRSYLCNQCKVMWKSKRPMDEVKESWKSKSLVSQIVMREVEESQWSVSPLAIYTHHL